MKLPVEYEKKMKALLKEEYEEYIKSFNEPRYYGLRVNELKISAEDFVKISPWELTRVDWCDTGFYYDGTNHRPAKHPYYGAGVFYIQEPSAMSTGAVLDVKPGDRVLDLCAAPGGKSTQVAAKLKGEGILVTNDVSSGRCKALLKNIELSGIKNAVVTNETPEKLAKKFEGFFNKIIVDAPCSGEGMFRKDENAVKSWQTHKSEDCCKLQRQILASAARLLSPGGTIAYSTCTFAPEEDEGMISEFLRENKDFSLVDFDKTTGFIQGHPEWADGNEELKKCGRLMPYKVKGEGHFLAILKKEGEDVYPSEKSINFVSKDYEEYYRFFEENLNISPYGNLEKHKSGVISVPLGVDLSGLRVVRSGLYIGEIKKNRFEPSQAFAMTLKPEDVKRCVSFKSEEEALKRYLKGETIESQGEDGWCLVCVENFPLGWGKRVKGRLKNKYLPGWIQQ